MKLNPFKKVLIVTVFLSVTATVFTSSVYSAPAKTPAPTKGSPKEEKSPAAPEAQKGSPAALVPEVLGAKAFLEDLLVRRYAQELSTSVDRGSFSLGAQLELVEVPPAKDPEDDTPSDLLLGTLDPEELLKKYAGAEGALQSQLFLKNYRIASVNLSVGLSEKLSPEVKTQVEKWLKDRLSLEFGQAGKGSVSLIRVPLPPAPPKTFLDLLNQFQNFAGQLVLALAILLGTLLWKLIASKDQSSPSEGADSSASAGGGGGAGAGAGGLGFGGGADGSGGGGASGDSKNEESSDQVHEKEISERIQTLKDIKKFTRQISELNPKFTGNCEQVLRTWCASGEEGQMKLACYAEAVGKEMGKLPIPIDALSDLSKVFIKMPDLGITEKLGFLKKIYWDVLTVINLGPEALEVPFGYLSNLNTGTVSQVLLEENPKMKALVSLYMPPQLRENYLASLGADIKRSLLEAAAQMTEMPTDEFKSIDVSVKGKLKPKENQGSISLGMGLSKLVSALSPIEELSILQGMTGPAFESLKRSMPLIAYIPFWNDEKLRYLISKALPDELTVYLRLCPQFTDRILGLAPEMTVELVKDELSRPDSMNEKDKNRLLGDLGNRVKQLVQSKEVDLEQVFPAQSPESGGGQVVGSIGNAEGSENDTKKAA